MPISSNNPTYTEKAIVHVMIDGFCLRSILVIEPGSSFVAPRSSSGRPPRDRTEEKNKVPVRTTKYKEKFQALREKYDRVIAQQAEYQQDLDAASSRIKKLQAENDLLLDAMNLAAAHEPSLFKLSSPPFPPSESQRPSLDSFMNPIMPDSEITTPTARGPPSVSPRSAHPNGNTHNGNTNGARNRTIDPPHDTDGPLQTAPESSANDSNGRAQ